MKYALIAAALTAVMGIAASSPAAAASPGPGVCVMDGSGEGCS